MLDVLFLGFSGWNVLDIDRLFRGSEFEKYVYSFGILFVNSNIFISVIL